MQKSKSKKLISLGVLVFLGISTISVVLADSVAGIGHLVLEDDMTFRPGNGWYSEGYQPDLTFNWQASSSGWSALAGIGIPGNTHPSGWHYRSMCLNVREASDFRLELDWTWYSGSGDIWHTSIELYSTDGTLMARMGYHDAWAGASGYNFIYTYNDDASGYTGWKSGSYNSAPYSGSKKLIFYRDEGSLRSSMGGGFYCRNNGKILGTIKFKIGSYSGYMRNYANGKLEHLKLYAPRLTLDSVSSNAVLSDGVYVTNYHNPIVYVSNPDQAIARVELWQNGAFYHGGGSSTNWNTMGLGCIFNGFGTYDVTVKGYDVRGALVNEVSLTFIYADFGISWYTGSRIHTSTTGFHVKVWDPQYVIDKCVLKHDGNTIHTSNIPSPHVVDFGFVGFWDNYFHPGINTITIEGYSNGLLIGAPTITVEVYGNIGFVSPSNYYHTIKSGITVKTNDAQGTASKVKFVNRGVSFWDYSKDSYGRFSVYINNLAYGRNTVYAYAYAADGTYMSYTYRYIYRDIPEPIEPIFPFPKEPILLR
jgi:hypothetical protein